jgi:hypothetical protein
MKLLKDYISESISTGKHTKKYSAFPKKRTDKDGIINWLEDNGYVYIDRNSIDGDTDTELLKYSETTGNDYYTLGKYNVESSHWIRATKDGKVYFIRTNDYLGGNCFFRTQSSLNGPAKYISYEQIIDAMNE